MNDDFDADEGRSSFLFIILAGPLVSGLFLVSMLVCGNLTLYVIGVLFALTAFAYLHYVLWGQSLSQEVEGEREGSAFREYLEETPQDD